MNRLRGALELVLERIALWGNPVPRVMRDHYAVAVAVIVVIPTIAGCVADVGRPAPDPIVDAPAEVGRPPAPAIPSGCIVDPGSDSAQCSSGLLLRDSGAGWGAYECAPGVTVPPPCFVLNFSDQVDVWCCPGVTP